MTPRRIFGAVLLVLPALGGGLLALSIASSSYRVNRFLRIAHEPWRVFTASPVLLGVTALGFVSIVIGFALLVFPERRSLSRSS